MNPPLLALTCAPLDSTWHRLVRIAAKAVAGRHVGGPDSSLGRNNGAAHRTIEAALPSMMLPGLRRPTPMPHAGESSSGALQPPSNGVHLHSCSLAAFEAAGLC